MKCDKCGAETVVPEALRKDGVRLLHYSETPFVFDRDYSYNQRREHDHKPNGLWLSVEGSDDWKSWCEAEKFGLDRLKHVSEVRLRPSAKIRIIDSVPGIDAFTRLYGVGDASELRGIKWAAVKEDCDGIVIAPYQWPRRLDLMWYYTWDCASAVIWNLSAVEEVSPAMNVGSPTDNGGSQGGKR